VKVLHVIARVNLGRAARWLETLTAEQLAAGDEVVVATGHVQGDEVEDLDASSMSLVHTVHGHLLTGYFSPSVVCMPASLALSS